MKKKLTRLIEHIWYNDPITGTWLMPLGFFYYDICRLRKFLYKIGFLKTYQMPVPVIIVGNITVGGTGKTPLVIHLAKTLKEAGFKPGIISRGYGGSSNIQAQAVTINSDVHEVGDEALMIAKQSLCPVVVCSLRVAAAKELLATTDCNVILSDDGLQHYALARNIEIAVIDGERRFGNGYCLPAGPLREPVSRLQAVDFIVVNGKKSADHEFSMQLNGNIAINLVNNQQKLLTDFIGTDCHALAGIGHPERFFKQLASAGLTCINHPFPDHYHYQSQDINFSDNRPILMTEKDAVKCTDFANTQHWYVPVTAEVEPNFTEQLIHLLQRTA